MGLSYTDPETGIKYYHWGRTHSYTNCAVYFVIGGRTIGKTYGLRKKNIYEYINTGNRWVEIVRTESDLPAFEKDYFGKLILKGEFPRHQFKIESHCAYIAKKCNDDETPEWELMGYFLAMTKEQKAKYRTFVNVRNFTFDEAIIDKNHSRYSRYLPNEWDIILGLMSSALREIPGQKKTGVRVNLLGNACDLTCPFFEAMGVTKVPAVDTRTFWGDGDKDGNVKIMVHRLPENPRSYKDDTVVGILSKGTLADTFFDNVFAGEKSPFIMDMPVPDRARHQFNVKFGRSFGVYLDTEQYYLWVGKPLDKNKTFVIAREDMSIDYVMLRHADYIRKMVRDMYAIGAVRYENATYMGAFYQMLNALNIK